MSKRKLLLSGATIKELRTECEQFLEETAGIYPGAVKLPPEAYLTEKIAPPLVIPTVEKELAPLQEANNLGFDSEGMPWDERIHASSHAKTEKGIWRSRRGVEKSEILAVENELIKAGRTTVDPVIPPPPVEVPAPPLHVVPTPAVPAPIAAPPMPPMTAASVHTFDTFKNNLAQTLTSLVEQGKLTREYVTRLNAHYGVANIWEVNESQSFQMYNEFCQHGLLQRAEQ